MTSQAPFEGKLLTELKQVVAANPEPPPERARMRIRRPVRIAVPAACVAAIVVAVVIIASSGSAPESAYAVSSGSDGTVTVEISSLRDADGLERKLNDAGIPAVVTYVEHPKACPAGVPGGGPTSTRQREFGAAQKKDGGGPSFSTGGSGPGGPRSVGPGGPPGVGEGAGPGISTVRVDADGHATFTLDPKDYRGKTLEITASLGNVSTLQMAVLKKKEGSAPAPCVPGVPAP
jgi:hypothetical protein